MRFLFTLTTIFFIFLGEDVFAHVKHKQTLLKNRESFCSFKYQKKHHQTNKALNLDNDLDRNIAVRKNTRFITAFSTNQSSVQLENSFKDISNYTLYTHPRSKNHYVSLLLFPFHSFLEQLFLKHKNSI